MNRTMWARSAASAQRNPARRCFTHSLLTALIVFPLPGLTLCYLFSQEMLRFPYLKLPLTHSKTYFKRGNFREQFQTELLLSAPTACSIVCANTPALCHLAPQHSWGLWSQVQLEVWSVVNFCLITTTIKKKKGKKAPLELLTNPGIKPEECRVWGAASWWPPTAVHK